MDSATLIARDRLPHAIAAAEAMTRRTVMRIHRELDRTALDPRKQAIIRRLRILFVKHYRP